MGWIEGASSLFGGAGGGKYGGGGAGPSSASSRSDLLGGASTFSAPFTVNTAPGGSAGGLVSPIAQLAAIAVLGLGVIVWLRKKS